MVHSTATGAARKLPTTAPDSPVWDRLSRLPRRVQVLLAAGWLPPGPAAEAAIRYGLTGVHSGAAEAAAIGRRSPLSRLAAAALGVAAAAAFPNYRVSVALTAAASVADRRWVQATALAAIGPGCQFRPEWRSATAVALAAEIAESRNWGLFPILADSLQDSGCSCEELLLHLQRGPWSLADWAVWNLLQWE